MATPAHGICNTVFTWVEAAEQQLLSCGAFFGHGTDNARDEAAWLVAGALGLPLDGQLADADVSAADSIRLESLLRQRCKQKVPTAYLLGEAWFAGLPFTVDRRVLIPRSPIAELIQNGFAPWLQQTPQRILDIGTGSGCIAVALAVAFASAEVDAVDDGTLELARHNVNRHKLDGRINIIDSDIYSSLDGKRYDLIVANPPYVPTDELAALPAEYMHEPRAALAGGDDGLDVVRGIVAGAAGQLHDHGLLVVETGYDSEQRVSAAFPGLTPLWLDLQGGGDGVWLLSASELAAAT